MAVRRGTTFSGPVTVNNEGFLSPVQVVAATSAGPDVTEGIVKISATPSAAANSVTLAGRAGQTQVIFNAGATAASVNPPTSGTINGTSAYTVSANTAATFTYVTDTVVAAIG